MYLNGAHHPSGRGIIDMISATLSVVQLETRGLADATCAIRNDRDAGTRWTSMDCFGFLSCPRDLKLLAPRTRDGIDWLFCFLSRTQADRSTIFLKVLNLRKIQNNSKEKALAGP
jgi:hypothetical protein